MMTSILSSIITNRIASIRSMLDVLTNSRSDYPVGAFPMDVVTSVEDYAKYLSMDRIPQSKESVNEFTTALGSFSAAPLREYVRKDIDPLWTITDWTARRDLQRFGIEYTIAVLTVVGSVDITVASHLLFLYTSTGAHASIALKEAIGMMLWTINPIYRDVYTGWDRDRIDTLQQRTTMARDPDIVRAAIEVTDHAIHGITCIVEGVPVQAQGSFILAWIWKNATWRPGPQVSLIDRH